ARWEAIQVLGRPGRLVTTAAGLVAQCAQEVLASALVMSVELAVAGDQQQPVGAATVRAALGELDLDEATGVFGRPWVERDAPREPGVEEEDRDRPAASQPQSIGAGGVDLRDGGLPGREQGELDALLHERLERLQVGRRLRQPHAARPVSECALEF